MRLPRRWGWTIPKYHHSKKNYPNLRRRWFFPIYQTHPWQYRSKIKNHFINITKASHIYVLVRKYFHQFKHYSKCITSPTEHQFDRVVIGEYGGRLIRGIIIAVSLMSCVWWMRALFNTNIAEVSNGSEVTRSHKKRWKNVLLMPNMEHHAISTNRHHQWEWLTPKWLSSINTKPSTGRSHISFLQTKRISCTLMVRRLNAICEIRFILIPSSFKWIWQILDSLNLTPMSFWRCCWMSDKWRVGSSRISRLI